MLHVDVSVHAQCKRRVTLCAESGLQGVRGTETAWRNRLKDLDLTFIHPRSEKKSRKENNGIAGF